jgi:hypothetical protein
MMIALQHFHSISSIPYMHWLRLRLLTSLTQLHTRFQTPAKARDGLMVYRVCRKRTRFVLADNRAAETGSLVYT